MSTNVTRQWATESIGVVMKERAPRNRTLTCGDAEVSALASELLRLAAPARPEEIIGRIIEFRRRVLSGIAAWNQLPTVPLVVSPASPSNEDESEG